MRQGEIWLINLDPTLGAEIKKTRPAVIINHDSLGKLPLKVIVPITDWKDRYIIAPWMIKIESSSTNGLTKISSIDCFQIRSVSEKRFTNWLGYINASQQMQIQEAVSGVLMIE